MREIRRAIVHCSYTPPSMDIGVSEIRAWHMARGWLDVGYHYVIRRNGVKEQGRRIAMVGAHAKGHNDDSIGICLVGGSSEANEPDCNFTLKQYRQLNRLRKGLEATYGPLEWIGHRDVDNRACPTFDVGAFFG